LSGHRVARTRRRSSSISSCWTSTVNGRIAASSTTAVVASFEIKQP
jgi:hypothetical protein